MTTEQITNAREWIAALRSGEYTQTQRLLHRTEPAMVLDENAEPTDEVVFPAGYCCLGVAYDLLGKKCAIRGTYYPEDAGYLEYEDADQIGIYDLWNSQEFLINLNDNAHLTFPQIADTIETRLNEVLAEQAA